MRCAPDGQTIEIAGGGGGGGGAPLRCFTFNAMLGPEAAQADVYERSGVRPLLARALGGYACTVCVAVTGVLGAQIGVYILVVVAFFYLTFFLYKKNIYEK